MRFFSNPAVFPSLNGVGKKVHQKGITILIASFISSKLLDNKIKVGGIKESYLWTLCMGNDQKPLELAKIYSYFINYNSIPNFVVNKSR